MKKLFAIALYLATLLSASAQTLGPVSPPCSGTPTTINCTTSVTSPLHIGGSGTTQSLTYQTTTGVGIAGADHIFLTGNAGTTQPVRFYNSGAASFGGSLDKGAVGLVSVQGTATSGVYIKNTVNGTGNLGTVDIQNSTGVELSIAANEPGRSVALFGITLGNWASVIDIGTNGLLIGEFANAPVVFGTNNLERMRLLAGICIGCTTDPGAGSWQANAQAFMPNITTSSVAQTGTVCWTTGTGKFTVDTTVGCLTSLLSAKNITEQLKPERALDMVSRLEPFAFHYKPGWGDGGRYEQFGFGAEQVALVDERMVGRDPDGNLQGVRYQELTAVLAGAIQELKADNDNLRACQATWKCRIFGVK